MTCEESFMVGVIAAISGLVATGINFTTITRAGCLFWTVISFGFIGIAFYFTLPWLSVGGDNCVAFNYKTALAKMPIERVQQSPGRTAWGHGNDGYSVRQDAYRVGWANNGRVGNIRN